MATQLIIPRQLDANGDPASGAKALVYETGTTTPVTVYTDTALSVAHASPIVANSAGYLAQAFYGGSIALKVVITDSADATLVTYDPVPLVSLSNAAASDVTFAPTTEIPQTDVQAAIVEPIVFDRMAAAALTGSDTKLVTGTAGANGDIATWNADGDVVGGTQPAQLTAMVFIESQDAAGDATLDFTGFNAAIYDGYLFMLHNLKPATDGVSLRMRMSNDGGTSFVGTAAYDSVGQALTATAGTPTPAYFGNAGAGSTSLVLSSEDIGNSGTEYGFSGRIDVHKPVAGSAKYTMNGGYENTSNVTVHATGAGQCTDGTIDAVRFYFSSDNIASGTITMYGLRNS